MLDAANDLKEELADSHVGRCVSGTLTVYHTDKLMEGLLNAVPPSNLTRSRNSTIIRGLLKMNRKVI